MVTITASAGFLKKGDTESYKEQQGQRVAKFSCKTRTKSENSLCLILRIILELQKSKQYGTGFKTYHWNRIKNPEKSYTYVSNKKIVFLTNGTRNWIFTSKNTNLGLCLMPYTKNGLKI